jgi:hypothetical protein
VTETPKPASEAPSSRDWALRWQQEFEAANREVKKWHESGQEIVKRYKVDKERMETNPGAQLNIFTVNVLTQHGLLYGRLPQVSVERRFADSKDDVARVAGELLERLLNADIERTGDTYAEALGNVLTDRLTPGMGQARVRYEVKWKEEAGKPAMVGAGGEELAPAVPAAKSKEYECAATDYAYWKDFRWSPARTWDMVRWVAFGSDMSEEQLKDRFPQTWNLVPLNSSLPKEKQQEGQKDLWARARVWEIWDKPSRRVFWWCEGMEVCIEVKEDTLNLSRFFPCPKPLLGVTATDSILPTPDFEVAKSLYNEVDNLTARIDLLTSAVRVAGVYNGQNEGIKRILSDKRENALIPVDNWAMFAERGGIKGAVDWFPLEQVTQALVVLQQQRDIAKANLYEVTGLSDILRGQGAESGVTATEQALKAKYASVRLQKLQDEFARFASELQEIKAEVITNLYDVETILAQANAEFMQEDPALLRQAAELLKSKFAHYRVKVKPEAVSMQDFAQIRAERTELLQGVTQFMSAMAPIAQAMPGSMPFLLEILQWFVSGLRGSSQIEGVLDSAIQAAQQVASQPQQAPQQDMSKVAAQQAKGQADLMKVEAESKARLTEIAAETAADRQREEDQMRFNVAEHAAKQQISAALKPPQAPGGAGVRGAGGAT